jgi:hypothetical protein
MISASPPFAANGECRHLGPAALQRRRLGIVHDQVRWRFGRWRLGQARTGRAANCDHRGAGDCRQKMTPRHFHGLFLLSSVLYQHRELGRLADAVFPVLAIVLGGLALPHPSFCAEHPRGEGYGFEANAGSSGIPRASSPSPDKMPV